MVPILINRGVFEPSYNDLKFTVQNCDYFCTNLKYLVLKKVSGIVFNAYANNVSIQELICYEPKFSYIKSVHFLPHFTEILYQAMLS